ncbi:hypothetical protein CEXT_668871 [Caerostris extrusa]|uniref:Uncharacterized protein n=1 Tax=Caerostris extrusa TaxID=172846 RepID=A0AAV4MRR2_CAEEX|nr:hypothetical protein CEXT_668871 [Caerostris extrusa]
MCTDFFNLMFSKLRTFFHSALRRKRRKWPQSFKPVLIHDLVLEDHGAHFVKCYSANLHLLSNEYPETQEEEEHLQPAPYPTNCTDYEALWEKNNKTGPRSQEVSKFPYWTTYEKQ